VGRDRALEGSVCIWKAAASGGQEKARKVVAKRREVLLLLVVTVAALTGKGREGDEEDAVSNSE